MDELMNIFRMDESRLSMTGWMNCLEEVLGWILEAEEHLLSLHNLGHRYVLVLKFVHKGMYLKVNLFIMVCTCT